jgi:hypothetical protein
MHAVGGRGTIGRWGWDVEEGPWAAPADEVLDAAGQLVRAYPPAAQGGGLVEGWVTLVGHDLMSDELVAGASDLARAIKHLHDDPARRAELAANGRRTEEESGWAAQQQTYLGVFERLLGEAEAAGAAAYGRAG